MFNSTREQLLSSRTNFILHWIVQEVAAAAIIFSFSPPLLKKGKKETNSMNWEISVCGAK